MHKDPEVGLSRQQVPEKRARCVRQITDPVVFKIKPRVVGPEVSASVFLKGVEGELTSAVDGYLLFVFNERIFCNDIVMRDWCCK